LPRWRSAATSTKRCILTYIATAFIASAFFQEALGRKRIDTISDRQRKRLTIRLFGPLTFRLADGQQVRLPAGRQQALLALLATAPDMQRNRSWLIDKLWTESPPERGRANLRQLLHESKRSFGETLGNLFDIGSDSIGLRPELVELAGRPGDGELLEGFDLPQEGFEDWLRDQRMTKDGAVARAVLYSAAPVSRLKPRIVVFPFGEITESGCQGIGDAIAHEITSGFARSQLIDSISHLSAQTLSGLQVPSSCTGNVLDADYAITGHCRLAGDRLTVNMTLFDMDDQTSIWSDTHRAGFGAFLAGEDVLAAHVVGQSLRLMMSKSVTASQARPLTELEAHRLT
jgi:TolB-like protein